MRLRTENKDDAFKTPRYGDTIGIEESSGGTTNIYKLGKKNNNKN